MHEFFAGELMLEILVGSSETEIENMHWKIIHSVATNDVSLVISCSIICKEILLSLVICSLSCDQDMGSGFLTGKFTCS